jgi:hypothetical protein
MRGNAVAGDDGRYEERFVHIQVAWASSSAKRNDQPTPQQVGYTTFMVFSSSQKIGEGKALIEPPHI